MKRIGKAISILVLGGSLTGSAFAADGIIVKEQAGDNYCHMKFPAVREKTLFTDHPRVKSSRTGDIIDFYGPCDETPTNSDEIAMQKREELLDWKE